MKVGARREFLVMFRCYFYSPKIKCQENNLNKLKNTVTIVVRSHCSSSRLLTDERKHLTLSEISGFRRVVVEVFALLGCYAA
jgi:hypothetical protein